MNKLAKMIANGEITVSELAQANDLIDRAVLVTKGIEACKKTILFPLGVDRVDCYSYVDKEGEYETWGEVSINGVFTCYCNWGGDHVVDTANLNDFSDVFMPFENKEFADDLTRFFNQQIEKSKE